jgi:hypothetical protein
MTSPVPDELQREKERRPLAFAMGSPRQTGEPCPRCGPGPSVELFETSLRKFYQCLVCRRPFGYARATDGRTPDGRDRPRPLVPGGRDAALQKTPAP